MSSIGLMGGPRGFNWVIKGQQAAKRSKGDQGVQGDPNVLSNGQNGHFLAIAQTI